MASNYPTSIDSFNDPLSNSPLNNPSHAGQHQDLNDAVEKLETKLGVGSSPASGAASGHVLVANGSGSTTWQAPAVTAAQFANVGLMYITHTTVGTGVLSVTVSNCFSSTYDNYRIIYMGGSASASENLKFQFGPSSVSGYNANYYQLVHYSFWNGTSSNNVAGSNNATTWPYVGYHDSESVRFSADIFNPNRAEWASFANAPYLAPASGGFCVGVHQNNGQYTDFTLTPGGSGNTFTGGTITVYGYKKG